MHFFRVAPQNRSIFPDLDAPSVNGSILLDTAVKFNHVDVVMLLLEAGACFTPHTLHTASNGDDEAMIKILLKCD